MRKIVSIGLTIVLSAGMQSGMLAAQDPAPRSSTVTGTAHGANTQALPNALIQIRSTNTGDLFGTAVTNDTGEFAFTNLPAGNYVVEVVDAEGKILGIGSPFSVAANSAMTTSVAASASGAAAVSSGGFSLFGMGPVTSMVVIGAASAASVTAVVATRSNASPSQ